MDRFLVVFSSGAAAVDLWAFGEDELAERMLDVDDDEMLEVWRTATTFHDESYPLPVTGRRITLGHVVAFAAMQHLTGEIRPLQRQRRRPANDTPAHLLAARRAKDATVTELNLRLTAPGRESAWSRLRRRANRLVTRDR